MKLDNTHITINLDIITQNFQAISQKAGVPVMAVVKADAYGHGAIRIAQHLQTHCSFFGVSSILEALELRNAGICTPILILGQTPAAAFPRAIRENIRPTIFRYEDALAFSQAAQEAGVNAPFHIAVDTGMGRLGFQVTEEDANVCKEIAQLPGIYPEGLFSHFATADCEDLSQAKAQAERFDRFADMLAQRGVEIPIKHLDNSAGIMNFTSHYQMVRAGIVLYGMYPSDQVSPDLLNIQSALTWESRVTHIKCLEPGRPIGYGGTFVTEQPTVVATIPVGYADGYRTTLNNHFHVLIGGKKAPILGRICMDQMMVDVTDIPGVSIGDRVVLIGSYKDETITMEEISREASSFNYEFVCGISRRVPKYYRQDGKIVHQVHYLLDK